jgi:hypothetical protein
MLFFVGWHQPVNGPSGCGGFDHAMISINRLLKRRSKFAVKKWILDSGAFTRLTSEQGHLPVEEYAKEILRWSNNGELLAAVSQDYLCDPFVLKATGLTILESQRLTIQRYDELKATLQELNTIRELERSFHDVYDDFESDESQMEPLVVPYIMPVLQGYEPQDYVRHLEQYGERLAHGAWVGVGSVCRRNSKPGEIESILLAIHSDRPDLKLHGFGLKKTALTSSIVWDILYSADSQASTFAAWRNGANHNDPRYAIEYAESLRPPAQMSIFGV